MLRQSEAAASAHTAGAFVHRRWHSRPVLDSARQEHACTLQSAPDQPARHWQEPSVHMPCPLQKLRS